jgi:TPR repeat protein
MKTALKILALLLACLSQMNLKAEDAVDQAKKETDAVKEVRKAAEKGEAKAQFKLGDAYREGKGAPKDETEAGKWYRKAAEQGDAAAQFNLGFAYHEGHGVAKDEAEAVKWLRKAAEQGFAKAQNNLGFVYHHGEGVPKDDMEAVKWYTKAAEQGNAAAQNALGWAYHEGQGVAKDDAEAVKWLRKAAEQGNAKAQKNLGFVYDNGQGVPKDDAEAVKWFRKAAEQGFAEAQYSLGFAYHEGRGLPKDEAEAVKWCRKAAEQGYVNAQNALGFSYSKGQGVPKDDVEAVNWFRKAADQGYAAAQFHLGFAYYYGEGVPKDEAEAVKWCMKAAEQSNIDALNFMGLELRKKHKLTESAIYFNKALSINPIYWQAIFNLGLVMEEQGNLDQAIDFYERALQYDNSLQTLNSLANARNNRGLGFRAKEQLQAAEADFRRVIYCLPSYWQAHFNLGLILEQSKKYKDAIAEYHETLHLNPGYEQAKNLLSNLANTLNNQGLVLRTNGDLLAAEGLFRVALQADEKFWQAHFNLGLVLEQSGNQKDAIAEYNETLRLNPGYLPAQQRLDEQAMPKNVVEAAKDLRQAAEQGDAKAQFNLGLAYENGQGVPKDETEAVKWYQKAAEQGYAEGQCNLGLAYYKGQGVPKNETEAVKWWRKATAQGESFAQNNLGWAYHNGEGVPKDDAEAVKWYRKAAEQGNALAQNNLGLAYQNGQGVTKDEAEAVKWFRKAAEQGESFAQNNLGWAYQNGQGVTKNEAEAVKWYRKAAEQGNSDALNVLAYRKSWLQTVFFVGFFVALIIAATIWTIYRKRKGHKSAGMIKRFFFPDNLKPLNTPHVIRRHAILLVLGLAFVAITLQPLRHIWLDCLKEGENAVVTIFGIRWIATPAMLTCFGSDSVNKNSACIGYFDTVIYGAHLCCDMLFLIVLAALWWKQPLLEGIKACLRKTVWVYIAIIYSICYLGGKLITVLGLYSGDPPIPWKILPLWAATIIFVLTGIAAPLTEEMIFRFGVFRFLRRRLSFILAGLVSSLFFGLAHLNYPDPRKIAIITLAGILFAWSYEKTGSLITPIGIHMLNNMLTFFM